MKVYLDNAATTAIAGEVVESMMPYYSEMYGNPSASHAIGREVKAAIEMARRNIASTINAHPLEIYFTSGGTEASNMALMGAVRDLGVKRIITTPIEHHCVLHTVEFLQKWISIDVDYLVIDHKGNIDLDNLEQLLGNNQSKTIVSIMHANNEIGTIAPLAAISALCQKYNALFHSDSVQTYGHIPIDVKELNIDFITSSAHKFHGPKGTGFLFSAKKNKIGPLLHGGGQERQLRAGTENITGIIGMAKAAELAFQNLSEDKAYIESVKQYLKSKLVQAFPGVGFNGETEDKQLFTILNVSFPPHPKNEVLLFMLDMKGVYASGGSACSSGADAGSHVIQAIGVEGNRKNIRFSFSKNNTKDEIDYAVKTIQEILN